MKQLGLLVWVPQFGISVVSPLILFVLLGVWLHSSRGWGSWVIIAGVLLGLFTAGLGLRDTLKAFIQQDRGSEDPPPAVSFNDHM